MSTWTGILSCADCGAELNRAEGVPESAKAGVALASAFVAGKCPNGCSPTFSDLNINTTLTWEEAGP